VVKFYYYVPKIGDSYFRLHFNFVGRIAGQWLITERACLIHVLNVLGSNLGLYKLKHDLSYFLPSTVTVSPNFCECRTIPVSPEIVPCRYVNLSA